MPTDEIIIGLFCMVDDQLGAVNKRSDAHLYPGEGVAERPVKVVHCKAKK